MGGCCVASQVWRTLRGTIWIFTNGIKNTVNDPYTATVLRDARSVNESVSLEVMEVFSHTLIYAHSFIVRVTYARQ